MRIGPLEISFKLQPPPAASVSPMREAGVRGVDVYGGYIGERERNPALVGANKYEVYSDLLVNTSVVAAGVRYFVNLVAKPSWKVTPADDSDEAKRLAEIVEDIVDDIDTPWPRIIRRATSFRFYGFGVHEWTAKRTKKGYIGLQSLNPRPQHTIEQWAVTDHGQVKGFYQRSNLIGVNAAHIYIPRTKTVYLVDDALTDSPEGMGVLRHLVEPYARLTKYLQLEGRGYERDLNGIPVGKVPYAALNAAVADGVLTKTEADAFVAAMKDFVKMEATGKATGMLIDSQPFESIGDNGRSVSSIAQWGIELLKGGSQAHQPIHQAIERTNREMARILGTEGLMLGGDGAGSLALSKDKSTTLLLQANSTLVDLREGMSDDLVNAIWLLNGFPEELKPRLTSEEIQQRDAEAVSKALNDMAKAGATLQPDDPVVNDVRDMLGVSNQPKDLAARAVERQKEKPPNPAASAGGEGAQPGDTSGHRND